MTQKMTLGLTVKAAGSMCRVAMSPMTVHSRVGFGMLSVDASDGAEVRVAPMPLYEGIRAR